MRTSPECSRHSRIASHAHAVVLQGERQTESAAACLHDVHAVWPQHVQQALHEGMRQHHGHRRAASAASSGRLCLSRGSCTSLGALAQSGMQAANTYSPDECRQPTHAHPVVRDNQQRHAGPPLPQRVDGGRHVAHGIHIQSCTERDVRNSPLCRHIQGTPAVANTGWLSIPGAVCQCPGRAANPACSRLGQRWASQHGNTPESISSRMARSGSRQANCSTSISLRSPPAV